MEYRYLGRTGLQVSPLCLGTMQFGWTADESTSHAILSASVEAGINLIDTANVYSRWVEGNPGGVAEKIIGEWLKKSGTSRDQIILATKVRGRMGNDPNDEGLSRKHILKAVEDSLHRLQTDYIDLYQVHFYDENTPIEETLATLDDLIHQGKVRYIGCSNYPAWRLMQALWSSDQLNLARFESLQPHYNLIHRDEFEDQLEDVCRTYGLAVIPYSPLARGFLTGKYHQDAPPPNSQRADRVMSYYTEKNWNILRLLEEMGMAKGNKSVSQMALAWLLARPTITSPIIGPRSLDQLQDNLGALQVELTQDEISQINTLSDPE